MKQFNILKQLLVATVVAIAGYAPAFAISSGTYRVGPGGDYPTLAAAVSDIGNPIVGPLTFNIMPGSYSGAGWQVDLTGITGTSASNPLTIKAEASTGADISFQGTVGANYVIRVSSVDYVRIKGLTITNTATDYGCVIELAGSSSYDSIANCTLTSMGTGTSAATSPVILMGATGNLFSGANNVIAGNVLNKGYAGVYMYGTSASAPTDGNIVTGNTIADPLVYGIYAHHAGALKVNANSINGTATTLEYGMYFNYLQKGGDIVNNTVNINTTTGTHYGIYNNYINNTTSTAFVMTGNTVGVTVSSGTAHMLYNNYCTDIVVNNNTFTATATGSGQLFPPTLMYYCTNSWAQGNTFTCTGTGAGIANTGTYNFMSYANNCTVRANTFNHTATTGRILGSTYNLMNNMVGSKCNNNTFNYTATTGAIFSPSGTGNFMSASTNSNVDSNRFNFTSTTGVIGHTGSGNTSTSGIGGWANVVGSTLRNNKFTFNTAYTATSYGIFGYYSGYNTQTTSNFEVSNDTFLVNMNASNTTYFMGYYPWYAAQNTTLRWNNNVFDVQAPNGIGTLYLLGVSYFQYYNAYAEMNGNKINVNTTSASSLYTLCNYNMYMCKAGSFSNNTSTVVATSGTIYNPYTVSSYCAAGFKSENNVFNTTSGSGTIYSPYYSSYYSSGSTESGNTFNVNATTATVHCPMSPAYFGSGDTCINNTWNINTTTGSVNMQNYYLNGLAKNNTWNVTTTSGTITNLYYYPQSSGNFIGNKLNLNSTSGTINCSQHNTSYYNSTTESFNVIGNTFKARTGGTIYGLYINSTPAGAMYMNNVFDLKTAGSTYMIYRSSGSYSNFLLYNNTFYSASTGSTNQLLYTSGSSTLKGKFIMRNNVIVRDNATATGNGIDVSDTAYISSDYNLVYSPGNITMRTGVPSVSTTSLHAWRIGTGNDMNTLSYDPGFTDPANSNFVPNAANPNSWALQGRGVHMPGDTLDILGQPRAKTRFDGVPDIGAYEFTPTSTPPNATAYPSTPSMNTRQVFTFGGDTVGYIDWGSTVPSTASVKQYTGVKAPGMTPAAVERTFFYIDVAAPTGVYEYIPNVKYKNPWLGNIGSETITKIARSSNGGAWVGYNNTDAITDSINNSMMPTNPLDSLSSRFTGVQNGRIGIRCFNSPKGLQHYDVTAFDAKLQWEEEYYPLGYQVVVDTSSTLDPSKIQFSSVANWNPTGLTENTLYNVWVRTICGLRDTSAWTMDTFRTMITCHPPVPSINQLTSRSAVISWPPVPTAVSYEYELNQSPLDPVAGTNVVLTGTHYNALTSGTEYYFHIRTHCSSIYEESEWTTLRFITPFTTGVDDVNGNIGIAAYPNPVKQTVTLNLSHKPVGKGVVTITDVTGKTVFTTEITDVKSSLEIGNVPSGMYLLKYVDEQSSGVIKLTKE